MVFVGVPIGLVVVAVGGVVVVVGAPRVVVEVVCAGFAVELMSVVGRAGGGSVSPAAGRPLGVDGCRVEGEAVDPSCEGGVEDDEESREG